MHLGVASPEKFCQFGNPSRKLCHRWDWLSFFEILAVEHGWIIPCHSFSWLRSSMIAYFTLLILSLSLYSSFRFVGRMVSGTWWNHHHLSWQVKHLVVAKMDGDQNSSPLQEEFSWTSYPHIFFVKAPLVRMNLKNNYIDIYGYICVWIYVWMYVCMNVSIYVCVCVWVCVCVYVCVLQEIPKFGSYKLMCVLMCVKLLFNFSWINEVKWGLSFAEITQRPNLLVNRDVNIQRFNLPTWDVEIDEHW